MIDGSGRIESTARILAAAGKRIDILRLRHVQWGFSTAIIATTESSFHTTYAMYVQSDWHISAFYFFLITISSRTKFDRRDSHCWRSLTERAGCASRSGYCTFNVASLGNIQDFGREKKRMGRHACIHLHARVRALAHKRAACIFCFHPREIMESSLPTRSRLLFFDTWQKNT